jgi:hypothetical protein
LTEALCLDDDDGALGWVGSLNSECGILLAVDLGAQGRLIDWAQHFSDEHSWFARSIPPFNGDWLDC